MGLEPKPPSVRQHGQDADEAVGCAHRSVPRVRSAAGFVRPLDPVTHERCPLPCPAGRRLRAAPAEPSEMQAHALRCCPKAAAQKALTRRVKKKTPPPIQVWKVVRGDKVEITSGKEKGKRGTVLKVYRQDQVQENMASCTHPIASSAPPTSSPPTPPAPNARESASIESPPPQHPGTAGNACRICVRESISNFSTRLWTP